MNGLKKFFNVLGILLAWVVSIALVVLLLVTPIVFSTLSLLNADTITEVFTQGFAPSAEAPEKPDEVQLVQLSNVTEDTQPNGIAIGDIDMSQIGNLEDILGNIDLSQFGDFGDIVIEDISQEALQEILESDMVTEIVDAYVGDVTNALTGSGEQPQFNSEKIKAIVNDNIDEFLDILQENIPELADTDMTEIKNSVLDAVNEGADRVINALPKPEEIVQEIVSSSPELEIALQVVAQKDNIKLAVIILIMVLSLLIFIFRIPGLRGFRWLATILFIAGIFNGFITVGLLVSGSAVGQISEMAGAQIAGIVSSLLGEFTNGMLIRTVVMLAAGVVLLVVYILIKKLRAKHLAKAQQTEALPVAETPAEEAPAAEDSAEEIPAEEAPAEEVSAEEIPAEETPAAEDSAEEVQA